MKIAFISYEYPPDTAYGGIATYVHQAAKMLHQHGHHVEVFTSSPYRSGTDTEDGILVHRVNEKEQQNFSKPIAHVFAQRHSVVQFDVLEGPDYRADAREAVRLVPDIPLVLKLHTPSIILWKVTYSEPSFWRKTRLYVGALRRGLKPVWGYDPNLEGERFQAFKINEVEQAHGLEADDIAAPSKAIGNKLIEEWGLDPAKVSHVPNPYIPSEKLLRIPIETYTNVVTFVGRLEILKGVLELAWAIPLILRSHPQVKFRFVGSSESSPQPNVDMQHYLEKMLRRCSDSVEFTGAVAFDRIPDVLATTDICVFPSYWESFAYVCLESMAAGRAVVASNSGGMADMLDSEQVGRLIPPRSPKEIAKAVNELLDNPKLRMDIGQAARDRLLSEYSAERVCALQEASYTRAIKRRRTLGARLPLSV